MYQNVAIELHLKNDCCISSLYKLGVYLKPWELNMHVKDHISKADNTYSMKDKQTGLTSNLLQLRI